MDCAGMQEDLGLSGTQMKNLLQDLRVATGSQKVVEGKAFEKIQTRNHRLDDFFELKDLVYNVKTKTQRSPAMSKYQPFCAPIWQVL